MGFGANLYVRDRMNKLAAFRVDGRKSGTSFLEGSSDGLCGFFSRCLDDLCIRQRYYMGAIWMGWDSLAATATILQSSYFEPMLINYDYAMNFDPQCVNELQKRLGSLPCSPDNLGFWQCQAFCCVLLGVYSTRGEFLYTEPPFSCFKP